MAATTAPQLRLLHQGDRGLVAEFGEVIAPEIYAEVQGLHQALLQQPIPGISEMVPT